MLPPWETLVAMSGFALAASARPGPVNIIGAMTRARYGVARALPFVTGATASFLALFLTFGSGMLAGTGWMISLARPMTLIGSAYLLWMAWQLGSWAETMEKSTACNTIRLPGFGRGPSCRR